MANLLEQFGQKWAFELPMDYIKLEGALSASPQVEDALAFSDSYSWFSLAQLTSFLPPDYWLTSICPFAMSRRGDYLCWNRMWLDNEAIGVAFCPRDSTNGIGFAPDFKGAIYRLFLEELSGSFLADRSPSPITNLGKAIEANLRAIGSLFPAPWSEFILDCLGRECFQTTTGTFAFLTVSDVERAVSRDLHFPQLNKRFRYRK